MRQLKFFDFRMDYIIPGIFILLIVTCTKRSWAQGFPENNCQNYFNYVSDNNGNWYGEIIFNNLALGTNRIDVRFSQRGTHLTNAVGALLPYPDELTARQNIGEHRAVAFRVSLASGAELLPKLTRLQLNGQELCRSNSPPNSFFNRFYNINVFRISTLEVSGTNINNVNKMIYNLNADSTNRVKEFMIDDIGTFPINFGDSSRSSGSSGTFVYQIDSDGNMITRGSSFPILNDVVPRRIPIATTESSRFNVNAAPQQPMTTRPQLTTRTQQQQQQQQHFECGIEGSTTALIHHGEGIMRGRFPWLTAIYHKENVNLNFKCSGSLVSTTIVITAAHCVDGRTEQQIGVSLGRHDLFSLSEEGVLTRDIQSIRRHRDYNLVTFSDADVAMLTLLIPVTYSIYIQPICIWRSDIDAEIGENEKGIVAGWGKDEHGNSITRTPKMVEAGIVNEAVCQRALNVTSLTSDRTLCAGNLDGSGPCMGDSGGGLMIKRNGRMMLRGIVSLGQRVEQQCNLSQYVVYCDLAKHIDWILQGLV